MQPGQRPSDGMRGLQPRAYRSPPPDLTGCGHANLIARTFLICREHTGYRNHVTTVLTLGGVLRQFLIRAIPATAQDGCNDFGFVDAIMISHGALQNGNDHPAG